VRFILKEETMSRYFLGIDIGGTKSHALIANDQGVALGFAEGPAGSYEYVGWDGLRHALHEVTDCVLASIKPAQARLSDRLSDRLSGVGLGIAGYDWPGEREPTRQAIASLALDAPLAFVNDTVIGLMAGATEGWGVAVVAGTGSNAHGRDREGNHGQMTGGGPVLGEYAGGDDLVTQAVFAIDRAWTRRGPETKLAEAFVRLAGAQDTLDLLEGIVLGRYTISASAAPVVFDVARAGDRVARDLIRWAGKELASQAIGVIRQLALEALTFEVVLIGSLYKGGALLIDPMREAIHEVAPGARLVRLTAPPVIGAVMLAMEQVGIDYPPLRPTLIETTEGLMTSHEEG
jgi:N-acetylglucosamine kinase-like BadF-type ATPase